MEHLKRMKEKLVNCVETEINGNLECTNTSELGEAVDMIKDLSEAIYYCTITEAMDDKSKYEKGSHYPAAHYYGDTMYYPNNNMMYASNGGNSYGNGSNRNYTPMMYASDGNAQSMGESRNYTPMMYNSGNGMSSYMYHSPEYGMPTHYPEYDGRSPMARRRYMDGKKMNDKNSQMRELEQYTQELTNDLVDMIKDASPEEKQLLQQKISMLATKIK